MPQRLSKRQLSHMGCTTLSGILFECLLVKMSNPFNVYLFPISQNNNKKSKSYSFYVNMNFFKEALAKKVSFVTGITLFHQIYLIISKKRAIASFLVHIGVFKKAFAKKVVKKAVVSHGMHYFIPNLI